MRRNSQTIYSHPRLQERLVDRRPAQGLHIRCRQSRLAISTDAVPPMRVLAFVYSDYRAAVTVLQSTAHGHGCLKRIGLGRAVLTPILMCVHPEKYAVYNRISEEALNRLGHNHAKATDTLGKRYEPSGETGSPGRLDFHCRG